MTHGLLDIVAPGFFDDITDEIKNNDELACLLGQDAKEQMETAQKQLAIEYAICSLLAGEETAIERAKQILDNHNIPICQASCVLLVLYGLNPIGIVALAYARGIHSEWDRTPSRYKVQIKAEYDRWVDVNYINHDGEERISVSIDLNQGVKWEDTPPSLNFSSKNSLSEAALSGAISRPISEIIDISALEDYVIEDEDKGNLLLKTHVPDETLDWLIYQEYPLFSWIDDVKAKADIMALIISEDFDIDNIIEHLTSMRSTGK